MQIYIILIHGRINLMNPVKKIQKQLSKIGNDKENKTGKIFFNAVKNELIKINGEITIPKIPVKELDYDLAVSIFPNILEFIPGFLNEHSLLEQRKPASDQHCLHFVKNIKGRIIDFIHILKIDLKFGGNSDNIIEKGDSLHYPSYKTDRLYYKSRIIPVEHMERNTEIAGFESIRLFDAEYVESSKRFFTSAIFDEMNKTEISDNINKTIDQDVFNISSDLYSFFVYDYFTACMNIINPLKLEIEEGISVFEPVFIYLFSKYKDLSELKDFDRIQDLFAESLFVKDSKQHLTESFLNKLREYFLRFNVYRDDELMEKRWWRLDIDQ